VEAPPRTWFMLAHRFWGVIPWMLEATVVIDLVLGRYAEAGVIAALLVFSAGLGFYQERHGKKAVALLRSQLTVSTRVRCDGTWQTVPAAELVPDDAVQLRVGDIVPADVALSDGVISLDQSQLTGESLSVEARAGAAAFTGSQVVRGEASGIVTATAGRTQFGKTAQLVQLARTPKRLQLLTVSIAKYLFALDVVLIAIVIVAAVIKGTTLSNTLPFALMLVASVPFTLPAMFTMSASMGAANLSKNGVLATRLSAIENAASMDVICVDKTGTITENHLSVEAVVALEPSSAEEVLRRAAAASESATQDPLDLAVLAEAEKRGLLDGHAPERLSFVPFDPATKHSEADVRLDGDTVHVVKGAPQVLAVVTANQGWLMHPLSVAWMASLFGVAIAYLVVGNAFRLVDAAMIRRVGSPRAPRSTSWASMTPDGRKDMPRGAPREGHLRRLHRRDLADQGSAYACPMHAHARPPRRATPPSPRTRSSAAASCPTTPCIRMRRQH